MNKNPIHEHDCEKCVYLGRYTHGDEIDPELSLIEEVQTDPAEYDLYVCAHNNQVKTVVARYGNKPEQYMSGITLSFGINPQLTEARIRAEI